MKSNSPDRLPTNGVALKRRLETARNQAIQSGEVLFHIPSNARPETLHLFVDSLLSASSYQTAQQIAKALESSATRSK